MRNERLCLSLWKFIACMAVLLVALGSCVRMPVRRASSWDGQTLYLAVIWHQHQPLYYRDPDAGVYSRYWAQQWRIGGGPADSNLDLLPIDDCALVPMIVGQQGVVSE